MKSGMSSQNSSVNVPTTTNSGNDGWTTVTQKRRGKKQAAPAQQTPAPEPVPEPAPVAAPAPEATPEPAPAKPVSIPATPAARAWASFRAGNTGTAPAPAPAPAAPAPVAESVESESEAGDSEADVESVPETTVEQTPAPAAPAPAPAPAKATPVKAPSKPAAPAAPAKPRAAPAAKPAPAPSKDGKVVRKLDFSKPKGDSKVERKPQPNADAYKAALQKAEAVFFDECLPKAAPVGQLKGASDAVLRATAFEQLATPAEFQLNWQAVACKAPIGEDFEPVKVGDREVTFSRRKFAENSFFQKKLRTHYLSKLPANCWVAFRFVGKPATDKQPSSEALLIKVGNRLE